MHLSFTLLKVDIEINDEPVDIHMKLDEFGAAFFVEDVCDDEDDRIPPELATSPIPGGTPADYKSSSSVNRSLLEEFNAVEKNEESDGEAKDKRLQDHKTKFNRKKRKRRQQYQRHSRGGSKSSLKDLTGGCEDSNSSSSNSGEAHESRATTGVAASAATPAATFTLGDDGENDGDLDDDDNESTPMNSLVSSTPLTKTNTRSDQEVMMTQSQTSVKSSESGEQSFLLSRLGDDPIEQILETQEKLEEKQQMLKKPPLNSYYSEPEMTPVTSPLGSRPGSPVLSDTEFETKRQLSTTDMKSPSDQEKQQNWEWGQLPSSSGGGDGSKKDEEESGEAAIGSKEEVKDKQRSSAWRFSFWKSRRTDENRDGVYLDDLKGDDEEMMAIYLGSAKQMAATGGSSSGGGLTAPTAASVDDDAESGNGPSLPMSPHSVEGAIGGIVAPNDDDRNFAK